MLATGTLAALTAYRRRQQRHRRPGRIVTSPPLGTAALERALGVTSEDGALHVDALHRLLLDLAATYAGSELPHVAAVRLAADEVQLLLTDNADDPPDGWVASTDGSRWIATKDVAGTITPGETFAPYPLLVSVGRDEAGGIWLLNLEHLGVLSLRGDPTRAANLARFCAAELAHNAWAELVDVAVLGLGDDIIGINPDRLHTASPDDSWPRDNSGEPWLRQVRIAPASQHAGPLDAVGGAAAVIFGGDSDVDGSTSTFISASGSLSLPSLGLVLTAEQLPADEAAIIGALLASAAELEDASIPPAHGDQPWDHYADACGGLVLPPQQATDGDFAVRVVPTDRKRSSVLPLPAKAYEAAAATTVEDVDAIAPDVQPRVRREVLRADPTLDDDMRDWFASDCPRPRISVLGDVRVRASGSLPERSPQEALHTEIAVLIALHDQGILPAALAEAIWHSDPTPSVIGRAYVAMYRIRTWLGKDPESGRDYLPSNREDPSSANYRIEGGLLDADLFRRLRLRAQAKEVGGVDDLITALSLVEGPPFHKIQRPRAGRPGGYVWLTEGNIRFDIEYRAMIVDTAHTAATHFLAVGDPERAIAAAQVALQAEAYDDVPLLDLVKANLDLGRDAEAESWVQQLLANNNAEIEEDLPRRTAEILFSLDNQRTHRAS